MATAPNVQDGKKVDAPCVKCPQATNVVCDVTKLQVRVAMVGEQSVDRSLEPLTKKRIREPYSTITEHAVADLLDTYDHVIDCIAGYPSREDATATGYRQNSAVNKGTADDAKAGQQTRHSEGAKDIVRIEALGHWMTQCAGTTHPYITMKQVTGKTSWKYNVATGQYDRKLFKDLEVKGDRIAPVEFWADSVGQDFGQASSGLAVLFDVIRTLWPTHSPRMIEVRATSCGNRGRNNATKPNRDLAVLVRIFRKDTYQIGIKIPPLGSYEQKKAGSVTGPDFSSSERNYSAGYGAFKGEKSASNNAATGEYAYTDNKWTPRGGQGNSLSNQDQSGSLGFARDRQMVDWNSKDGTRTSTETTGLFGGTQTNTELGEALKRGHGFQLVIKRNDREFTLPIGGGDGKSWKEKIVDGLNKVLDGIKRAIDTFNKLPQLGYKLEFKASVLEGTLVAQWEPKLLSPTPNGRYNPVKHKFSFKISMDIINVTIDLSFGVDAQALGTGIVAKVGLNGGVKITVEKEVAFNIPWDSGYDTATVVGLKPEAKFGGYAVGYASLLGWSVVDAKLECTLTFNMPNGQLKFDAKNGLVITGTFRREPVYLRGYVKGFFGYKQMNPVKVCDGADIHRF